MNTVELDHALRKLRLSGMADVLETRLRQAQTEKMAPIDTVSALVCDELQRRQDRLFERRTKKAAFRDTGRSLDSFNFDFNRKMNRALVCELATARFVAQREDALFLGPSGTGKSHLAQAIGRAAILQGFRVVYREAHALIEEIADATLDGSRKEYLADLASVPLLIVDDLGMRKLSHTAAEDLLELVMCRYERASTLLTSNRPVDDWGELLGDTADGYGTAARAQVRSGLWTLPRLTRAWTAPRSPPRGSPPTPAWARANGRRRPRAAWETGQADGQCPTAPTGLTCAGISADVTK